MYNNLDTVSDFVQNFGTSFLRTLAASSSQRGGGGGDGGGGGGGGVTDAAYNALAAQAGTPYIVVI